MTIQEKKEKIIELRKAGATYRQIGNALGYPKHSHGGGFVSKVLKESGHITSSDERAERKQSVLEFLKHGGTYGEAAERFGLSVGYVKQIYYKSGAIRSGKEKRNTEMRAYKAEGHSMKEVAERFGVSEGLASQICKGITPLPKTGMSKEKREEIRLRELPKYEEAARQTIAEKAQGFEYVDGYTNSDGTVNVRCKVCGCVQSRSMITIRHRNIECDNCKRIAAEKKAEQEERQRRLEDERREWANAGKRKAKQLAFAVCGCCGSLFFPESGGNTAYCSDECRRKVTNTVSKDKRLRRISKVLVDKDIDLKDLFKRDNGVCAICGKRCRWDDSSTRDDGTFLAFGDYPSIDHIVPLSKGGKHSWNNVQLACRSCNSRKGNRV